MNADGSRTIRVVDLVAYAEESVQERIREQQETIAALREENTRLRIQVDATRETPMRIAYAEAMHDLMTRYYDGEPLPMSAHPDTQEVQENG